MERIVERPGALDVHKESVTACVRVWDGRELEEQMAEFRTTVQGLLALRDWLEALGVKHVAMEATGVYWRPVWAILEDRFELMLVNARHVKAVPGRTTDPEVLADLAKGKLRKKIPELREALIGRFDTEHALIVSQILAHIDFLDEAIDRLSAEIEERIAPFARQRDLLMTIPGVKQRAAEVLIAEIGVDMSVFPTPKHLASWAKVCPGNDESVGKRRSGKTGKGNKWLRATLTEAANAATRTKDSYLAAQYQRRRGRRGHSKAVTAVAHSILTATWHMLQNGELYNDLGGDYFTRQNPDRVTKRLVRQLEALGHTVTLEPREIAA